MATFLVMDGEPAVTEEEFKTWPLIGDAFQTVLAEQGNDAYFSFVKRLASGLIRSAAEHYRRDSGKLEGLVTIRHKVWEAVEERGHLYTQQFWTTNDLTVTIHVSYDRSNKHEFFTVRVDPVGVAKMLPSKQKAKPALAPAAAYAAQAIPSSIPLDEPEAKRPPVSQAALTAWYDAYLIAFAETDTEAKALESAKGCFPGKSVSRDAVRALRGCQKRGPKPKTAK